jgi:hypothetical protein
MRRNTRNTNAIVATREEDDPERRQNERQNEPCASRTRHARLIALVERSSETRQ